MRFGQDYIRWKAAPALIFLFVLLIASFYFFFDRELEWWLEKLASGRNGAAVTIGSLHTDFWHGRLDMRGIEVAEVYDPRKDLFAIDRLSVHFLIAPLLRKKIVIPEITIEGISLGVPRRTSGELPEGFERPLGVPALMNRVASGAYQSLNHQVNDNPLKHLSYLSTGLELGLKVYQLRDHFSSMRRTESLKTNISQFTKKWNDALDKLPGDTFWAQFRAPSGRRPAAIGEAARKQVARLKSQVQADITQLANEADKLRTELGPMPSLIDKDVALVHYKLGVPRLDSPDLTSAIFGRRLLEYLEALTYWVDLSRRRMPKGIATTLWPSFSEGVSVHFGKATAYPTILVPLISATSKASDGPFSGDVSVRIDGLNTQPSMMKVPLKLEAHAEFPSSNIINLDAEGLVDHTGTDNKEHFSLTIESFPVHDWKFHDSGDLKLSIKKAIGKLSVSGDFNEGELNLTWDLSLHDVDYGINAVDRRLSEVLENGLQPLTSFSWSGEAKGPYEDIDIQETSPLGKRVAEVLRDGFHFEMVALDDNIRARIRELVEPRRAELIADVRTFQTRATAMLQATLDKLNTL